MYPRWKYGVPVLDHVVLYEVVPQECRRTNTKNISRFQSSYQVLASCWWSYNTGTLVAFPLATGSDMRNFQMCHCGAEVWQCFNYVPGTVVGCAWIVIVCKYYRNAKLINVIEKWKPHDRKVFILPVVSFCSNNFPLYYYFCINGTEYSTSRRE